MQDLTPFTSNFNNQVKKSILDELPVIGTRVGQIIGDDEFAEKAMKKFDRRQSQERDIESKRIDDIQFDPVEKVFHELKNIHQIEVKDLDTTNYEGKRLRGKLLVYLKDRGGLKYSEIIKFPVFSGLKLHSLGRLYKDAKERLKSDK